MRPARQITLTKGKEEFLVEVEKAQHLIDTAGYKDPTGEFVPTKKPKTGGKKTSGGKDDSKDDTTGGGAKDDTTAVGQGDDTTDGASGT